jgi:hypothetical protein
MCFFSDYWSLPLKGRMARKVLKALNAPILFDFVVAPFEAATAAAA